MEFHDLQIEVKDRICTLTLNRPEQFNAVSRRMHRELGDVWPYLEDRGDVRAVVLTGAGRGFCAGGDMEMSQACVDDAGARRLVVEEARRIVNAMVNFPIPIVAAVNGPAIGLGCSLALFSDIVIMSEKAFLSDPHVQVGLVAADGGVLAWPVLTSLLWAKEFLLTGDRVLPERALAIGLANHIEAPERLLGRAYDFAERIANLSPQAVQDTKRALHIHLGRAVSSAIDFAFASESHSFSDPHVAEAIADFANRSKRGAP